MKFWDDIAIGASPDFTDVVTVATELLGAPVETLADEVDYITGGVHYRVVDDDFTDDAPGVRFLWSVSVPGWDEPSTHAAADALFDRIAAARPGWGLQLWRDGLTLLDRTRAADRV